ncbi:hypothetical protein RT717_07915 [Imperialibacter roseus]|uniref:Carboxypeptidase regulatory-like domain-containing protein n=1 Tax=Imperialibacter roseus TaxID=1324217 RepID=A0ABZ0IW00_9BACT|nr:hypothetical protein [Imperialibacter roseus]WOK08559.1 hypothetical protein RT717_07915 [Imperialibacter roseus]
MKPWLVSAIVLLISFSCRQDDDSDCWPADPKRNSDAVTIKQGLWGDVWLYEGDFAPICASGSITPVERTIHIYQQATRKDAEVFEGTLIFFKTVKTDLIATTTSNAKGFFEVYLEPGIYSVFVQEGDSLYANRGTADGINTVTISEGQVAELLFEITYARYF